LHKDLEPTCVALDALATAVTNAWGVDTTACENLGWFAPAVTRHDLANLALTLAADIRSTDTDSLDTSTVNLIQDLPRRLQILLANTVPHMFTADSGQAIPAYISTLSLFRSALLPAIGWQLVTDNNSLPPTLARRARAAQAELDQLIPNIDNFSQQIKDIQSAHKIADSLPIDLQSLAEARDKLNKSSIESASLEEKIKNAHNNSSDYLGSMKKYSEEAEKLMQQCEEAYHVTTTKGLAGAFDQRAGKLALSMWVWVFGLAAALGIGSFIGAHRLEIISAALQAPNPNWGSIGIQAVFSLLSVGAPLWFAWLATKQIGQRFRLAEDYAFKASVAKAYEGYRKEAARIDPKFESRLFGSALTRLDEPPLRLIETGTHGSPWHELANSEAVRQTFNAIPELQEKMTVLLQECIATTGKVFAKSEEKTKVADPESQA